MAKKKHSDIKLIELSSYVRPEIEENYGRKYVLNGRDNSFFRYVIDRYNGSPTNQRILNNKCKLVYGKGITQKGGLEIYEDLAEIFNKREQEKCIKDFELQSQYAMQLVKSKGGGIASISHIAIDKLGMEKMNNKGEVDNVYYCEDWTKTYKYIPKRYPVFKGKMTESVMIKLVQPYQPGKFYYPNPIYLAGLQYAQMEEEISNYCINHIMNGLSFGYIINFNNGSALSDLQKDEIERKIKAKLTGSTNAGKFIISFNDSKEAEVTVVPLEVNDAHSQWEFLSKEAMNKIVVAHGAYPAVMGLETASGFNSNADELDVQSKLVQDYLITPDQQLFIDELAPLLELNSLDTDLEFIPLRDTYKSTEETIEKETTKVTDKTVDDENIDGDNVELSSQNIELLLNKGEDINFDEWEVVDDSRCDEITLKESDLNTVFEFASVPKTSNKKSIQDTSIFKIRYKYAGNPKGEREFCNKLIQANKLFRAEDLDANYNYNEDFAPEGKDSYNIFKFKGGVNCKHWWQRIVFLKKDNKKISVSQARKMILALDPKDRKNARWKANDKVVAQPAQAKNNYHSLKPNYRNSRVTPKEI